ncbi:MAG TPA: SUMF1/EgtB/PvdO family nonheme iron enzyme [Candidatus Acidoferrales bacterium]|nr:SUMF1/EgtB/PvdO family nonheme iron enzyme [Candidatus Acidoferrales bacterium]
MRFFCLGIAAGLSCCLCPAGDLCGVSKRAPGTSAITAFENIAVAVGLRQGTILLFASSDQKVKDRSGAASDECPGANGTERWILYDPELISSNLALYFALAHEIAHHINHDLLSGDEPGKRQELEADRFAAMSLAKPPLTFTREELLQGLNALPLPKEAKGGYPSLEERRVQVSQGYDDAPRSPRRVLEPAPVNKTGPPPPPAGTLPAGARRTNPKDGLTYVWIPPATFRMGCSPGDSDCMPDQDEPAHDVTITGGFWIGQTEVTQEAYQKVTGSNPSHFRGPKLPVETVSSEAAAAYCEAVGGRLPTEAEWELAARGGVASARYGPIESVGWYLGNAGGRTHEVAQKQANAFGLYDMLGNVLEWVSNWYVDKPPAEGVDPQGPDRGSARALRGGSWVDPAWAHRASFRAGAPLGLSDEGIGFRCAVR